ncbi:MAG: class I poly(R)-hydroxyalkanoic acid synthase [Sphingomonadaceae bacterium]|nr:class I poly(R)-hydroxyalkanoic acid synthase [Sphingomonadaceae bacterium]
MADTHGQDLPPQDGEAGDAAATAWMPSLADMQQWTRLIGQAQQLILEHSVAQEGSAAPFAGLAMPAMPQLGMPQLGVPQPDVEAIAKAQAELFAQGLSLWQHFLTPGSVPPPKTAALAEKDRRFAAPQWSLPIFDLMRQTYLLVAEHLLASIDTLALDAKQREQLRFATRAFVEAASPSNFLLTNPQVLERIVETKGASLIRGMEHLLRDLQRGQLSHVPEGAFELGRNIATTPGKVIRETPLYQLIHYAPTTEEVLETPLVIFPAWINRFYVLDLTPEKSFVRYALDRGISVFIVSWKSADDSLAETTFDDYVVRGQVDAIDAVRDLLGVPSVHAIGYCVAGTTLAATLAYLAATGEPEKVASATFFTAQVDFSQAGELKLFIDDPQLAMLGAVSDGSFLDGRYMAATFNLLRGRDLIWNYVVDNYLLGNDYKAFDLLHWNGDTTNLPSRWHGAYLRDFYRDNKLVVPGALSVDGVPLDLGKVETPAYVQAGREDHIAPPESVWKITDHFVGPIRFVLAGSGHTAGVVNPPSSGKYQYWTNDHPAPDLAGFIAGAQETKGSWWPDWAQWLTTLSKQRVPAKGARIPGEGKLPSLEDAPGSYVRTR